VSRLVRYHGRGFAQVSWNFGTSLAELKRGDVEGGGGAESGDLKGTIDDWIQVIDSWVHDLDQRMGGTAEGADPEENGSPPTDPAPRPAPESPR
jgi:hypothetical protein